jgi:8-oxo-dGTP diphosphatase
MMRLPVRLDLVIFAIRGGELQVLLWRRDDEPFAGQWSLPGGFLEDGEPLERAARRVLHKRTGFQEDVYLEQLYTFCDPGVDPRGDLVSVAYYAVVAPSRTAPDGFFHPAREAPPLVFHHGRILATGIERLRTKAEYATVPLRFLDERFTLSEAQAVYEALLGRPLDKRNFRRKIAALEAIERVPGRRGGAHRPARLFRLSPEHPHWLKEKGILFPF